VTRWTKEIGERPAVKRGRMVNRTSGPPEQQLHERHDASDFETKTGQDRRAPVIRQTVKRGHGNM
jgi:GST-like protein